MPSRPAAALFDIGNVLLGVDFVRGLLPLVPAEVDDPRKRLKSLLEKREDFESGRLNQDTFVKWASSRLGFVGPHEEFRHAWNSIFDPIREMWPILAFLRSLRVKLILFSNTNCMHAEWLLQHYPVFEQFEGSIFSHEVGSCKPDPAIYHHAMSRYGLTPRDTLYVDDLKENIETGENLGFRCHQYARSRHLEFVTWLKGQLGVIDGWPRRPLSP